MYCRRCNYSIAQGTSHICPECGRRFDPADLATYLGHPRRIHDSAKAAATTVLHIILAALALSIPFLLAIGGLILAAYLQEIVTP